MSLKLNSTVNGIQPPNCSSLGNLTAETVGKTFAFGLILVVSLVGNTLIGIIVYKTKTMRKTMNYFIVNMAMFDLLFSVFIFPEKIAEFYVESWHNGQGPISQIFCKVNSFILFISCVVSTESMILIAMDRFGAVVFPLRRPLNTSKLCLFMILATWILAVIVSFPALFAYKAVEYKGKLMCMMRFDDSYVGGVYFHVVQLLLDVISFALIIVLYSIIIFKLKSQKVPGEPSNNAEEQRARRHRKVLKMAVAIGLAFTLCWTPIDTYSFLSYFVWDNTTRFSCAATQFRFSARFMASANCAINPCICFTFGGYYRQGLKSLLRCHGRSTGNTRR